MNITEKITKFIARLTGSGEVGGFQAPDRTAAAEKFTRERWREERLAKEREAAQKERMRQQARPEPNPQEETTIEVPEDGEAA